MKRYWRTGAALVAATGLAAGCSSDSDGSVPTSGAKPSVLASTVPVVQPSSPSEQLVSVGQPFQQKSAYNHGAPYQTTVSRFRCGITRYPFMASAVSGDIAQDTPAVPASGNQFCQADIVVKNTGTTPIDSPQAVNDETVVSAGGATYATTDLSEAISYTIMSDANNAGKKTGWFLGDTANPGETVYQTYVWEIPSGATAASLVFSGSYGNIPTRVSLQ